LAQAILAQACAAWPFWYGPVTLASWWRVAVGGVLPLSHAEGLFEEDAIFVARRVAGLAALVGALRRGDLHAAPSFPGGSRRSPPTSGEARLRAACPAWAEARAGACCGRPAGLGRGGFAGLARAAQPHQWPPLALCQGRCCGRAERDWRCWAATGACHPSCSGPCRSSMGPFPLAALRCGRTRRTAQQVG